MVCTTFSAASGAASFFDPPSELHPASIKLETIMEMTAFLPHRLSMYQLPPYLLITNPFCKRLLLVCAYYNSRAPTARYKNLTIYSTYFTVYNKAAFESVFLPIRILGFILILFPGGSNTPAGSGPSFP